MPFAPRVAALTKRALFVPDAAPEADLAELDGPAVDDASTSRSTHVRRGIAVAAVGSVVAMFGLGVATIGTSTATATSNVASLNSTGNQLDTSKAVPDSISVQRAAAIAATAQKKAQAQSGGNLSAFSSTTTSRSTVRSALSAAVSSQGVDVRSTTLSSDATDAQAAVAAALAESRNQVLASDITKAKAMSKKYADEAKAAAAQLKGLKLTGAQVSSLVSSQGGCTPIAPGSYTLGAHWHQVGSWSSWHTGQDFPAAIGTPIRAVAAGVVGTPVGGGWAGNNIVLHMGNGGSTLYAHMQSTTVKPGDVVKPCQVIGYVGMTGRTFGPHLHFEYYPAGTTPGDVYSTGDPIAYLRSVGVTP